METISYVAALISALAMAGVYLLDFIMTGETYDRPSQPMFVSSLFAVTPVLLLPLFGWSMPSAEMAWLGVGCGVMIALGNWLYFQVIYSDVGEATEVACYEASRVPFMVVILLLLGLFSVSYWESITSWQLVGVALGGIGLVAINLAGTAPPSGEAPTEEESTPVTWPHRRKLIGFMMLASLYSFGIDGALHVVMEETGQSAREAYISLSPFFWIGMMSGMVALLPKRERIGWHESWPKIRHGLVWVLLAEIIAVIAYGAEIFAFSGGHVAVMVLVGAILLRPKFGEDTFPRAERPLAKLAAVALVVTGAVLATS